MLIKTTKVDLNRFRTIKEYILYAIDKYYNEYSSNITIDFIIKPEDYRYLEDLGFRISFMSIKDIKYNRTYYGTKISWRK